MERVTPTDGGAVLAGVTAAHSLAVAASPFLPFVDLPQHVAMARLLWNLRRPDLAQLYEADLVPQVNVLALVLGGPLHALLPEAAAVRVLVILAIAALAWALLRLARAAGRSAWVAVAAMPFALHFGWMYGFLSFGLGIPVLLLLLARLARAAAGARPAELDAGGSSTATSRPSAQQFETWLAWRTVLADAALWWLVLLAHALLLVFGVVALALWLAVSSGDWTVRLRRAAAVLPAGLWGAAWWVHTRAIVDRLDPGGGWGGLESSWHGFTTKLFMVGQALVVASTDGRSEWMVLAFLGVFAAATLAFELRAREASRARRFLRVVALLALLAYATLPFSVAPRERATYGLFLLYPRFLVFVPLLLLPTLRWPSRAQLALPLMVLVCAANVVIIGREVTLFTQVARQAQGLDAAIATIPPGRIVKSLVYTPRPVGSRYPAFLHVASYYQARALGETDQSFALLPTNPVHYRDPRRPYLSRRDEHLRPYEFNRQHATMYDLVLVYDRDGRWRNYYQSWGRPPVFARNGWIVLGPP